MADTTKNAETPKEKLIKNFSGVVVSDKNDQTIVVSVERTLRHKLYGKLYKRSRKFHVHDPKNEFKIGDTVEFIPCRPISKMKKWRVVYSQEKN